MAATTTRSRKKALPRKPRAATAPARAAPAASRVTLARVQRALRNPRASAVKPTPLASERDYLWDPEKIGKLPDANRYRDLPIVSGESFDDVSGVWTALETMQMGQFWRAAQLCDSFGFDDRISGVMQTRVDALIGLPLQLTPGGPKKKAQKTVDRATEEWGQWFSDAEVKKVLRSGLYLGVGLGELLWDTSEPGYWKPRLKAWDVRYLYWRFDTRSFWLTTMDGQIEVRPGNGHWVLYCPNGYFRGWMHGLVRSLALLYLIRRWGLRDWARYSEVHGLPIKKAMVPAGLPPEDKEEFLRDLRDIGAEGVIRLAQDENGKGFDMELLEAASQSWEGFDRLLAKADECIAVDVLGQNLTTSAKAGGSYALGDVHDRIRMDRVEADGKSLGACITEQVLKPWAAYNFGDAELAPHAGWSTKGPEDRATTAKTWSDVSNALQKFDASGMPLDKIAIAEKFQVPVIPGAPVGPVKQLPPDGPGQDGSKEPPADTKKTGDDGDA